jgi:hypothetical protein
MPEDAKAPADLNAQVKAILADTAAHGFIWEYGHLVKNGIQVTKGAGAPLPKHVDLDKVRKTFGDAYILNSMDGSSVKVAVQGTIRDYLYDNRQDNGNIELLQNLAVQRMLGVKQPRKQTVIEKRIYIASDDTEFESKADLLAYEAELKANA